MRRRAAAARAPTSSAMPRNSKRPRPRCSSAIGRRTAGPSSPIWRPSTAPIRSSSRCRRTVLTADAGYHSEANLQHLDTMRVPALIADHGMRKRDPRFATQERHQQAPEVWSARVPTGSRAFGGHAHQNRAFSTASTIRAVLRGCRRAHTIDARTPNVKAQHVSLAARHSGTDPWLCARARSPSHRAPLLGDALGEVHLEQRLVGNIALVRQRPKFIEQALR